MHDLAPLLARWHEWRSGYSHERKFARVNLGDELADDDEEGQLERMLLASIEEEIGRLPRPMQLALQHAARTDALGIAAFNNPRLPTGNTLEALTAQAKRRLWDRLIYLGLI